jgi:hypothetical protein
MTITKSLHVFCWIRLNKQVITLRQINTQVMNLPAVNVAGFISRRISSTSSKNTVSPKQNNISMTSGWQKPEKMQRGHLIYSLKSMNSSIRKPPSALKKIEKNSWPFMIFLLTTGHI